MLAYLELQYVHSMSPIYGVFNLPTWANPVESLAVASMIRHQLLPSSDYVNLGLLGGSGYEHESGHFPARNLLLILLAAAAGYREIVIAIQKDETDLVDRSPDFLKNAARIATEQVGETVVVWSPFLSVDKTSMVQSAVRGFRDAAKNKRARLLLETSWSCYRPVRTAHHLNYVDAISPEPFIHCGNCPACVRRFIAFNPADVKTHYAVHPATSIMGDLYWRRAKQGKYSPERNGRIIAALESYRGGPDDVGEAAESREGGDPVHT